ncbi:hypothetical protein BAT_3120 [Bacillus pumilus ATCC 7061]|nr:hypothetical protein BAT_3120 [Bacillus pumilus ATCC 7061]
MTNSFVFISMLSSAKLLELSNNMAHHLLQESSLYISRYYNKFISL